MSALREKLSAAAPATTAHPSATSPPAPIAHRPECAPSEYTARIGDSAATSTSALSSPIRVASAKPVVVTITTGSGQTVRQASGSVVTNAAVHSAPAGPASVPAATSTTAAAQNRAATAASTGSGRGTASERIVAVVIAATVREDARCRDRRQGYPPSGEYASRQTTKIGLQPDARRGAAT